jgi:hypothetical protein
VIVVETDAAASHRVREELETATSEAVEDALDG